MKLWFDLNEIPENENDAMEFSRPKALKEFIFLIHSREETLNWEELKSVLTLEKYNSNCKTYYEFLFG